MNGTDEKADGGSRPRPSFLFPRFMPPLSQFKRFDVRELIGRGVEPLPEILERAGQLQPREGLIIVAPFLPSPLIERLGADGFVSKVERGQGADWIIYFWREDG